MPPKALASTLLLALLLALAALPHPASATLWASGARKVQDYLFAIKVRTVVPQLHLGAVCPP